MAHLFIPEKQDNQDESNKKRNNRKMLVREAEENLPMCMHCLTSAIEVKDVNESDSSVSEDKRYRQYLMCYAVICEMGRILLKDGWEEAKKNIM